MRLRKEEETRIHGRLMVEVEAGMAVDRDGLLDRRCSWPPEWCCVRGGGAATASWLVEV